MINNINIILDDWVAYGSLVFDYTSNIANPTDFPYHKLTLKPNQNDKICPNTVQFKTSTMELLKLHQLNEETILAMYRTYIYADPKIYHSTIPINLGGCEIDKQPYLNPYTNTYVDLICQHAVCAENDFDPCLEAINSKSHEDILYNCNTKKSDRQFHVAQENLILEQPTNVNIAKISEMTKLPIERSSLPAKVTFKGSVLLVNNMGQNTYITDNQPPTVTPLIDNDNKDEICNPPFRVLFYKYLTTSYIAIGIAAFFAILFTLSFDCTKSFCNRIRAKREWVPHLSTFLERSILLPSKAKDKRKPPTSI